MIVMKGMIPNTLRCLSEILVVLLVALLHQSCTLNGEFDKHYGTDIESIDDNVLKLLADNPDFSKFHDALVRYGFDKILTRNQYFTLFAPVNSAFDELPEYSDAEWKKILGFHILYARLFSNEFSDLRLLTSTGKYLIMNTEADEEFTIFEARINPGNVDKYCRNGVVHEIDRVLVPLPNIYEFIMSLDTAYSILQEFLNSMDIRYIDYERSVRIGVDDNGNAIYDTIWKEENYFLDQIAGLDDEKGAFTGFLPVNQDVRDALKEVSGYFGDIDQLDEETYNQLLFITFSGSFTGGIYTFEDMPDTLSSVTGKIIEKSRLKFGEPNLELSNGIVHLLSDMTIPKNYFLLPITIECEKKENRTVSTTTYPIEQRSDTRASNGAYVWYGSEFVGDYIEFTVKMVLKTTYWIIWTGPKLGPSHYQIFIKDDLTGEMVPVGDPVNNWTKGNFVPVVSGTHTFNEFGTKKVRIVIVDEAPLIGYNSIYVDYIKLVPDEIYIP